jgi:hypothetical protein
MERMNPAGYEEGIHICILVDFVACEDVDICLGLDFDQSS